MAYEQQRTVEVNGPHTMDLENRVQETRLPNKNVTAAGETSQIRSRGRNANADADTETEVSDQDDHADMESSEREFQKSEEVNNL
jgi:hypothetical protein